MARKWIIGLSVVLALIAAIILYKPLGYFLLQFINTRTGDSPGEVVGGTIYVKPKIPCTSSPCVFSTDDTTKLDFENLEDASATTAKNGWKFSISNKDRNETVHDDALIVCSAKDCSGAGDGKTYYVSFLPGVAPTPPPSGSTDAQAVYFHDYGHCAAGNPEDCDEIVQVKIYIPATSSGVTKKCDDGTGKHKCKIYIGNRK